MKREATEASVRYLADELDLLGLYLTTLLEFGNVEPDVEFTLTGMSAPLDTYYSSLDAGVTLDKPRPAISPLFAAIFSQLERRSAARWTEIGVALNMFSPDDQIKITRMLVKLEKRVHRNWRTQGHDKMVVCIPPKASTYALSYVMFKNGNAKESRGFMEHAAVTALESDHVQTVVVIGKNIDRDDAAYDAIAFIWGSDGHAWLARALLPPKEARSSLAAPRARRRRGAVGWAAPANRARARLLRRSGGGCAGRAGRASGRRGNGGARPRGGGAEGARRGGGDRRAPGGRVRGMRRGAGDGGRRAAAGQAAARRGAAPGGGLAGDGCAGDPDGGAARRRGRTEPRAAAGGGFAAGRGCARRRGRPAAPIRPADRRREAHDGGAGGPGTPALSPARFSARVFLAQAGGARAAELGGAARRRARLGRVRLDLRSGDRARAGSRSRTGRRLSSMSTAARCRRSWCGTATVWRRATC